MGHPWTPLFSKLQCPEHFSSKGKQGSHLPLPLPTVTTQPCFIQISFQMNFMRTQHKRRQPLYALAGQRMYTVFCREPSKVLSPGQYHEGSMQGSRSINPHSQCCRLALRSQSRAPRLGLLVDICVKMRSPGAGDWIAFRSLFLWLSVKWIGSVKR